MSHKETNIYVSLATYIIILSYFLINLLWMRQQGGLDADRIFRLWAIVIIAVIVINIVGNILTNLVLIIIKVIKTGSDKVEVIMEDERDKLIELKGERIAYIAYSIGVLIAMLTFVFDQPPLVMFTLIILFSLMASIIGELAQLYYYRSGVYYG